MAGTLLEELSALSHDQRVARLVALGKQSLSEAKARAEIDQLERGDAFARMLAVWTCFGSKDGARVLRAVHDVSARVRRLAFRLVAIACDDLQAFDAFQVAFGTRREKWLLLGLQSKGRSVVVDRALDWLAERTGIHDFADVVPLGSPAAVRRHLPRALTRPSAVFWERLARNAPDVLGDVLAQRVAAASGESDPVTRQLVGKFHHAIAERAPAQGLALAELLDARGIESSGDVWEALVETHLEEVLALRERRGKTLSLALPKARVAKLPLDLLARCVRANVTFGGRLEGLDEPRRRGIANAWAEVCDRFPLRDVELLAHVDDAASRERAYGLWRAAAMSSDGVIAIATIAKLPLVLREREARRHLHEVVALHTRPTERIAYAQFLPWAEAKSVTEEHLGHPEGAMRGITGAALLRVLVHREEVPEALADDALAMVLARKNEQDPVRGQLLGALVAWPREVWRPKHTRAIEQILRDALDASDLSPGTAYWGEALLVRSFRLEPTWAGAFLGTWLKARGHLQDPRLGTHLTEDEVRSAAPALLAIATTWAEQERHPMLLGLAESLAERMALVPGLFDVLEHARDAVPWGGWAVSFTLLMREHDEARYEATLPALTRRWLDKGWNAELAALAMSYDPGDSLDEDLALALERIVARSGSQAQVIVAVAALRSRANRRFGERIARMLEQDESLVALPAVHQFLHRRRQDLLTPYLEGRRVTGRFATGNTGWLLPFQTEFWRWNTRQSTLFAGQHLRVTTHTERDTPTILHSVATLPELCWAPMDGLIGLCDDERPVVKDKAIRIVARCDQAQGVPKLLRCLEDARARIAIYGLRKALKDLPPARSFKILTDVSLAKVTVAKEVLRLLGELRSDDAYAHLIRLDGEPLHRDVRIALLRSLWDHLEREPTWGVFERAVASPDWILASRLGDITADRLTETSDARLSKLLARVVARPEAEARLDLLRRGPFLAIKDPERAFLAGCRARLASPYDDEIAVAARATLYRSDEADIPALRATLEETMRLDRRSFTVAVTSILAHGTSRRVFVLAAGAAEEAAANEPALVPLRIRAARHARPEEVGPLLMTLADALALSCDAFLEAREAIDAAELERLVSLETLLASSAHPEVRRLAVHALARNAGSGRGWTPERLERLGTYQRDGSPIVAGAANAIFPPRELVPAALNPRATSSPSR